MWSSRRFGSGAVVALTAASCIAAGVSGGAASAQEQRVPGKIAFISDVDGDWEVFVMRADGSGRRQLTHNEVDDWSPSWSPDGRRLVFERERGENGYEDLYILDVASGTERPWVVSSGVDEGDAEWSPDGKWIAFRGNDGGDGSDVIALRVDKKRGRIVSSQSENSSNSDPTWSPDGREMALVEAYDGSGIYVASVCCSGGYEKESVTYSDGWKLALDWSPDATCIVYAEETYSEADGAGADIYTTRLDGGEPKLILQGDTWAAPGSWSPDGSQILFESTAGSSWDLYLMDADGSDVRRLTKSDKVNEGEPDWWAPPVAEPATPDCGQPASPSPGPTSLPSLPPA
ncbi:MAG TPA: hypothetical protein VG318_18150 [Actinomycetota bacterium]|nr:hypothetical protein [Actinomycetota bacterium]